MLDRYVRTQKSPRSRSWDPERKRGGRRRQSSSWRRRRGAPASSTWRVIREPRQQHPEIWEFKRFWWFLRFVRFRVAQKIKKKSKRGTCSSLERLFWSPPGQDFVWKRAPLSLLISFHFLGGRQLPRHSVDFVNLPRRSRKSEDWRRPRRSEDARTPSGRRSEDSRGYLPRQSADLDRIPLRQSMNEERLRFNEVARDSYLRRRSFGTRGTLLTIDPVGTEPFLASIAAPRFPLKYLHCQF